MKKHIFLLSAAFCVLLVLGPERAIADQVLTSSGSINASENTPLFFTISNLVSSSEPITSITIANGPFHGSIAPDGPIEDFIYTPNNFYVGLDSFDFLATDSSGDRSESSVFITVKEVNLPPATSTGNFQTPFNTPLTIELSSLASPTNGVPIVLYAVSVPSDGTIEGFDPGTGFLIYVPTTGFSGLDQFFYTAQAANGLKSESFVNIGVGGPISSAPEPGSLTLLLAGSTALARRIVQRPKQS